jgi:hypothetical protein
MGEPVSAHPDFATGAQAAITDRPLPEPDPALIEAMTVMVGPTRLIRVREAAQMAADHYSGQQAFVDWLIGLLTVISATVKGEPPDPVPDDWWDDLPDRVDDLARQAREVSEARRRDDLAARLSLLSIEKRVDDAREAEHARLAEQTATRRDDVLADWMKLCDSIHGLLNVFEGQGVEPNRRAS